MRKKGQSNTPVIILSILIITLLIILSFILIRYFKDNKDDPIRLENITRMEQIDDSITHNISLTNNPSSCQDECSARGLRRCSGNGYKICGNFDSDSCYEWSSITSCGDNEECSSGRCSTIQQEENLSNTPSSIIRYDFDGIELLEIEQFNASKIGSGSNTWADTIAGNSNSIEVTHAVFNLEKNGQVMKAEEEYIKIKGQNGEKRFLYNSGGGFLSLGGGLRSTQKQFWSAKQLIGDDVVKDKTPPVYSVVLWEILNEQNSLVSAKLAFSDEGLDFHNWDERYFDWSTNQSVNNNQTNPEQNQTDSEIYKCPGIVVEGLCHEDSDYSPVIRQNSYEDSNIKIWGSDYSSQISVGDEINFTLYLQNKLTTPYDLIDVTHEIPSSYFEIVSSELSQEYQTKHYNLHFNPSETKQYNMVLRAIKENLFSGDVFFGLGLANPSGVEFVSFQTKVESNKNYILCSGIKFPETFQDSSVGVYSFHSGDYNNAKCCNNVFYPSFECCSDKDCSQGKCVDGLCIDHIFQGFSGVKDPAIGNKQVLMILSSNEAKTDASPCFNKIAPYSELISNVENFYDLSAKNYLNESPDFINFNWTIIGNFNINDLGLSGDVAGTDILEKSLLSCGFDISQYNEFILYNPDQENWCAGIGACAGKPILIRSFENLNSFTVTHELAHNFGCSDLYILAGGTLQWVRSLMSYNEGDRNLTASELISPLDVCRGEMGWVDLNNNGIMDVKEYKSPEQNN